MRRKRSPLLKELRDKNAALLETNEDLNLELTYLRFVLANIWQGEQNRLSVQQLMLEVADKYAWKIKAPKWEAPK